MKPFATDVKTESAGQLPRQRASADSISSLKEKHRKSLSGEHSSCSETGRAGTDDRYIHTRDERH
jgi:hypothetical protein